MFTRATIYIKKGWDFCKTAILVIIIILPLSFSLFYEYTSFDISVFKEIGGAFAIITALFSFAFSWLADSKTHLLQIYDIQEAKDLYDKANEKSLQLVDNWRNSFVCSIFLFILGYGLSHFTQRTDIIEYKCLIYLLLIIEIMITFFILYSILSFFSSAKEILKFRNDLDKVIVEYNQSRNLPDFKKNDND